MEIRFPIQFKNPNKMTRKDFLKNVAALGIGAPFFSTLISSCTKDVNFYENIDPNFEGKVLIIGAGAAGLTAGYILNRYNIDFQIIEASSVYGGRVKKIEGFADFPIDLGGEWIHTNPSVLAELLSDSTVDANIDIINYNPQTIHVYKNGKIRKRNFGSHFYSEHKFKNTTWYGFFEKYMVPHFSDKIVYNSPVAAIDYSGEKVVVTNNSGETYEADKVLVTVPIKILQSDSISFAPALPSTKIDAIHSIDIPPILKVFIEFSERFYPDVLFVGSLNEDSLYYDAAFGKGSDKNVLGLFSISESAAYLTSLNSEQEIIDAVMSELDEIYDGKASQFYQKHVIQNWSAEPYIGGSYSHFGDSFNKTIDALIEPVNNKLYFAGEAINPEGDTATVHGAGQSAYAVVEMMLS